MKTDKERLILAMLKTFVQLGNTSMARISAAEFAVYYRKKIVKLGLLKK